MKKDHSFSKHLERVIRFRVKKAVDEEKTHQRERSRASLLRRLAALGGILASLLAAQYGKELAGIIAALLE